MCFHSKLTKQAKQIENRFNSKFEDISIFKEASHYNGFNFPKTPIITNKNQSKIEMFNWGLIPDWANNDWNKSFTLNARIETLKEKPAYKNYTENRCIILVDGFYEWQHRGKIKYEIGFNNKLFAFAGLYANNTYSIITTEAKGIMQDIHNTKLRMPFSLKSYNDFSDWLNGKDILPQYDFTTTSLDYTEPTLF
jgi:putative SOS response-associated peptidase YedK